VVPRCLPSTCQKNMSEQLRCISCCCAAQPRQRNVREGCRNCTDSMSRIAQGFGNPRYESGLQAAPSYTPPGGSSGGVASPRWGSGVASAAGSALSGAGNAISGAGSAMAGALSPRHRGRGSESMLTQVAAPPMHCMLCKSHGLCIQIVAAPVSI